MSRNQHRFGISQNARRLGNAFFGRFSSPPVTPVILNTVPATRVPADTLQYAVVNESNQPISPDLVATPVEDSLTATTIPTDRSYRRMRDNVVARLRRDWGITDQDVLQETNFQARYDNFLDWGAGLGVTDLETIDAVEDFVSFLYRSIYYDNNYRYPPITYNQYTDE